MDKGTNLSRRALLTRFAALVAAGFLPLLAGCGKKPPRLHALPTGATVLAFGDSVTYGTGARSGEDWPSLLAAMSGWKLVNAGVPGETSGEGRERLPSLLAAHSPKLLIIESGGNDFLRRIPASAVKENLRQMLRLARSAGTQVALVAVPELSLLSVVAKKPVDAPLYAELGQEEETPVIVGVFSEVLGTESLRADTVHPNADGYRRMAEGIHTALRRFGA